MASSGPFLNLMSIDPASLAVRDALFSHEMFDARQTNAIGYSLDELRDHEPALAFEREPIEAELNTLERERLVNAMGANAWFATPAGLVARERRWRERGLRNPALGDPGVPVRDRIIALVHSSGELDESLASQGLARPALLVLLFDVDPLVVVLELEALQAGGLLREDAGWFGTEPASVYLRADGRRYYVNEVVQRLGLVPPATILAPLQQEQLPFDELGLPPDIANNLRFRWEEAARCTKARAWLAAVVMEGSILELVLQAWLREDEVRAMSATGVPRGRGGAIKAVEDWTAAEMIRVAASLDWLEPSLAKYADGLRDTRNLIHPGKQVRERSQPDAGVAGISSQVVKAVLGARAKWCRTRESAG